MRVSLLRAARARSLWWRAAVALGACVAMWCAVVTAADPTAAAATPRPAATSEVEGTQAILEVLASTYRSADRTHDLVGAAHVRTMADALSAQLGRWSAAGAGGDLAEPETLASKLSGALASTREQFQPWPAPLRIAAQLARLRAELASAGLTAQPG